MINFVRRLSNPAMPHPPGRRRPYFEGWYYKVVDPGEEHVFAIIPGVFYGESLQHDHAFVQFLDGKTGRVVIENYPIAQFNSAEQTFDVRIGPNRFQRDSLTLDIPSGERPLRGSLQFENTQPWPVSVGSPGIMGWYAYVPFMQCNHGVVSLDHGIQGTLAVEGEAIDFGHGRGYIEKDWGESFPAAWAWSQTNHFNAPATSLTASIAIIPWLGTAFPGFIIGLLHAGVLHRFTTYNGSRVETLVPGEKHIDWVVRNKSHRLSLHIQRSKAFNLFAPTRTDMSGRVPESIDAHVDVQLHALERGKERLIFEDSGRNAGLEVAGDIARLVALWKK